MLCEYNGRKTKNRQYVLNDYPFNKLYIALKIILLSSLMGTSTAYAVDLPSSAAGCLDGTSECQITHAQGTDFTVTSNITSPTNGVSTDASVVDSTFTVNPNISVTGGGSSAGFKFVGGNGNTLTNNGFIRGDAGIEFSNESNFTLINNGTIDGRGNTNALANIGTGFTLTNNEGAIITALDTVIEGSTSGGGVTINNAGAITPDDDSHGVSIKLFGDNNTINLNTSSVISGDVQLDVNKTNNKLNLLGGSQSTGVFNNYVNSNSINFLNIDAAGKEWDISGTLPVSNAIHISNGNVVVIGTLINSGTGSTTLDAGTLLQIGNGGTSGEVNDNIINNATLIFNRSDDLTFTGIISGSGAVEQAGNGTTRLDSSSSYTGTTRIMSGTLQTGIADAFANSSSVVVSSGATLDLNDYNQQVQNLSGNGNIDLGSATLTINDSLSGGLNSVISGSGGLVKEGAGTLTLAGNSTYTGGTQINAGEVSTVTDTALGALTSDVTINNNAILAVGTSDFAHPITLGSGGGTVIGTAGMTDSGLIDGSGHLTMQGIIRLTADNTYTGGTTINTNSTLSLGFGTATGSVQGDITNNGVLAFNRTNAMTLDGTIDGGGRVDVFGAGTTTLTGANSYSGGTNIALGTVRLTGNGTLGSGAITLTAPGTLHIDAPTGGSYTFNNALTGGGTLQANLAATTDSFTLGAATGNTFNGTIKLGQGQFSLSGGNTAALTNATLQLDTGNTTTVASTDQSIGNLTFNGGTMAWSGQTPPQTPVGKVNVTNLTLTRGTVQVDVPETSGIPNPMPAPGLNLLAQDDGETQTQLVAASGTVSGSAASLGLVDSRGQVVNNPQTVAITEGGTTVANGSYDFMLSSGSNNDGLYLSYGLKALNLQNGQTLHLAPDSGASSNSAALNAQLTGSGNLDVNGSASATKTLTLNNVNNSYTGTTTVSGGSLVAGSDNALGSTSKLILASATGFDLNGKTQTLGSLSGAAGSTLNLNGGKLTLSQGGQSDGRLTGAGTLALNGGTTTINGANSGLSAAVTLNNTAQALLSDVVGLGVGTVNLNGTGTALRFNNASGTLVNTLSGTGDAHLQGNSAVLLSGNNSGFSGSFTLDSGTTLTASAAQNLGTAAINNGGALQLDSNTGWTFGNALSGSGTLEKSGSGNITIGSANTFSGATTISAGTLSLTNAQGLGSGAATVAPQSKLALNFSNGNFGNAVNNAGLLTVNGDANQLSGNISGNGTNQISATNLAISGDNSAFSGLWDLTSGSSTTVIAAQNLGAGSAQLNGTLNVTPASGNFAFTNALSGQGVLNVAMNSASDHFSFGANSGSAYTGLVSLGQGTFTLSGANTQALTNATLQIQSANQTVGAGTQKIGNVILNGGNSTFDVLTHSLIQTDKLALNGGEVWVNGLGSQPNPANAQGEPLLQQDDIIGDPLILSQSNSGSAAHLTLMDGSGNALVPTTADVTQLGKVVGIGTYGYGLTGSDLLEQSGLFLYSGLLKLELLAGQQVSLIQNANAPLGGNELHAQITGAGGLLVDVVNTVTLNNPLNDYTGQTTVNNGTLRLGIDHSLGKTSLVDMLGSSQLDLNGKNQSIGALNSASGTIVNLNGGNLTITDSQRAAGDTNGGTVSGRLVGSGQLVIDPSVLTIDGANPDLSATTLVIGGSEARLNNVQGLGTGSITLDGSNDLLTFNTFNGQTASGALNNTLLGKGSVQLNSSEVITLAADNSAFGGNFSIGKDATLIATAPQNLGSASISDNGTLQLDNSADMNLTNSVSGSGGLVKSGSGTLTVYQPDYSGTTNINNGTLIVGDGTKSDAQLGADGAGVVTVASGATLAGNGTVSGDVVNNGSLASLNGVSAYTSAAATVLKLSGNLTNNGLLQLAGSSIGNTLSVAGNYTGGGVLALQTVLGGDNSATDKLLVAGNTSGTTQVTVKNAGGSGAQTNTGVQVIDVGGQSDGVFNLTGRAVAGAYEYHLVKNTSNGDWYLQSQDSTPTPPNHYRPEPGAYLANQQAAQNMFLQTLYDRSGAVRNQQDSDSVKGWVRLGGDYTKQKSNGSLFDEKTHTTLVQVGSDVYQLDGADGDQINAGVMAAYGHSTSSVSVQNSGYEAKGQVNGYSLGAYGTWYAQADRVSGAYVDSWVQHAWYKNHVNGDDLPQESYNSQGTDVSVETGYGVALKQSEEVRWMVTPQAQLIYSHYDTSGHTEQNGTEVNANGDDGIRTRVGVRLTRQNIQVLNSAQPFVEVNWYNGKPASDSVDFNQVRFENATATNRYEAKVGISGNITQQWQGYGQISSTWGNNSYQGYQGMVGVKYQW